MTPRFYDKHYLQKLVPSGIPRKAPNHDKKVVVGVIQAFERITENEEESVLRDKSTTFHIKKDFI